MSATATALPSCCADSTGATCHGFDGAGQMAATTARFLAWALATVTIAFEVVTRADGGRRRRWLPPGVEPPMVPTVRGRPAEVGGGAVVCVAGPFPPPEQGLQYLPATSEAVIHLARDPGFAGPPASCVSRGVVEWLHWSSVKYEGPVGPIVVVVVQPGRGGASRRCWLEE